MQGAEKVIIGFYSLDSAYAFWNGKEWTNGLLSINDKVEKIQPVYMDSSGALYMQDDAVWYQLQTSPDLILSKFYPVEKAPDVVRPLNLEVSAVDSKKGKYNLSGTTNKFYRMAPGSARHYYEERTYEIPKGTQELIIALNFPWDFRDTSGKPTPKPPTNYPVVVNEIRIEGTDLIFDQAPVDPDEPSSPGDGDGSSSGSGSGGGGGGGDDSDDEIILPGNEDEDTWMDRTEMPVSSEESSLILSSSELESSGGKTSSGGNKSGSGKDGEADEEADRSSSEPESETLIYQSDRETIRDKLFSAMLAGYGVIGLGVAWQIYLHTIRKK